MITNDDENSYYPAVKSWSRLLTGITSNYNGDFYCLNVFHSYRTEGITSNYNGDFYCLNFFHSYRTKETLKNIKKYAKIMTIVM